MSHLSAFSDEDTALLIGLPYKVGIWISSVDDVEGERDDEREMKALEGCLRQIASLHKDRPMIQEIMSWTLKQKDQWPEWADQSFNILPDAQKAISLMKTKATEQDAKNLRRALLEVGATVARASSEFADYDGEEEPDGFFGKVIGKVVSGFSSLSEEDAGHPVNVSATEDTALSKLSAALRVKD